MGKAHESRAREKALFRYSSALDRGDFETVGAILGEAKGDPRLAQMILEVNEVYALELKQQWKSKSQAAPSQPHKYTSWIGYAAGVSVLIFVVAIAILTLLGPSIGNVSSNIIMSLDTDNSGGRQEPGNAAGTPIPWLNPPSSQERMIIKNGEIDLLVQNTDAAIDQVTQIATDNGGYVLSSQSSLDYNGLKSATLTIAVRADQFETAMRRLREIAIEVRRELSTGEDVTSEYVDLESQLRNLEATRDRVKSFLDEAQTVEEALKVSEQLSQIEGQIEEIKGRMAYLAGRSAFSTITVNIEQKVEATPTPTPTATPLWSLGPTIENATRSQTNLARGLLEAVTWLAIVPGPYFAAGGLILWGVLAITRRRKGSAAPPKSAPPPEES